MTYYIVGHDNRGTAEHPFGRIYLSLKKNGNVVGSLGYGSHRDNPDPYAVWPSNQTPTSACDPFLRDAAIAYLKKLYPDVRRLDEERLT